MILILGALLRNELIASKNPKLIVFCNMKTIHAIFTKYRKDPDLG